VNPSSRLNVVVHKHSRKKPKNSARPGCILCLVKRGRTIAGFLASSQDYSIATTLRTSARACPRVWGNSSLTRDRLWVFLQTRQAITCSSSDLVAAEGCCFQSIRPLEDGHHFQRLLSIVTGVSNHQLCRVFLLDRSAIATIRHDFQTRYSSTSFWLDKFFKETAANGFASAHGRHRYFDGLRSSNLEKRNSAVHSAVKWLVQW